MFSTSSRLARANKVRINKSVVGMPNAIQRNHLNGYPKVVIDY